MRTELKSKACDFVPVCMESFFKLLLSFLAISGKVVEFSCAETIISSHIGKIGAGNYTYFALHEKGSITLILESLLGDADLYVSKDLERPSFTDYDLQSATCGLDIVTVPRSYKRPVYIALFGHVHSGISKYKLSAIRDFEGSYEETHKEHDQPGFIIENEDEEETQSLKSLIWTIVVGILKILLEVIF